ncbi:MAG TPA: DUF3247 domain-containing protein [Xanthomonadaceae bacterium]|nr:DUF3247 domain-containing protein [Xanthomonadaceae bacterium]
MSRYAQHVYTGQSQIAALEAWIAKLPGAAQVQVTLEDGSRLLGTVAVQPTLQVFRDEQDENEGMNGLLRLDDLDTPVQQHLIWLDSIRDVRALPPRE